MHLPYTAKKYDGGEVGLDLGQVKEIGGGTIQVNPPGPLPPTTVTMMDGTIHSLDFFEHGRIISLIQANLGQ